MMKVKLTTSLSGTAGAFSPGDEYECSEAEAGRLIAAGYAEPIEVTAAAAREKAVARPVREKRSLVEKAKATARAVLRGEQTEG